MRTLALANQKGGVGKTTTTINLGTALAAIGQRVLILDMDPQGNASTGLGVDRAARRATTYDVMSGDVPIDEALHPTPMPNMMIVPGDFDLSGLEQELSGVARRNFRLRDAVQLHRDGAAARGEKPFEWVLIDCPPSLNLLTINALTAADAVLVPMQCEFFALEGLSQLLKTVELVREALNPELEIQGVVLTMMDHRNKLSGQVAADVREYFGDRVYETIIPRNVRVSEAPSYGKPALLYDMNCAGSLAYAALASELLGRERLRKVA